MNQPIVVVIQGQFQSKYVSATLQQDPADRLPIVGDVIRFENDGDSNHQLHTGTIRTRLFDYSGIQAGQAVQVVLTLGDVQQTS